MKEQINSNLKLIIYKSQQRHESLRNTTQRTIAIYTNKQSLMRHYHWPRSHLSIGDDV